MNTFMFGGAVILGGLSFYVGEHLADAINRLRNARHAERFLRRWQRSR